MRTGKRVLSHRDATLTRLDRTLRSSRSILLSSFVVGLSYCITPGKKKPPSSEAKSKKRSVPFKKKGPPRLLLFIFRQLFKTAPTFFPLSDVAIRFRLFFFAFSFSFSFPFFLKKNFPHLLSSSVLGRDMGKMKGR